MHYCKLVPASAVHGANGSWCRATSLTHSPTNILLSTDSLRARLLLTSGSKVLPLHLLTSAQPTAPLRFSLYCTCTMCDHFVSLQRASHLLVVGTCIGAAVALPRG